MEHTIQKKVIREVCPLDKATSFLWGSKNGYDLYSCSRCGLVFVPHSFLFTDSVSVVTEVYSEEYFSGASHGFGYVDYDADKEPMVPVFEKYLEIFEQLFATAGYARAPKSIFDVGAATGFFLNIARSHGYLPSGVEMSNFAARVARSKGLDVSTGDMLDLRLSSESQDVVTMLDVVEHMTDPFAELREAHRVLKAGGLLAINTPNGQSVLARLLKTRWHLVVPPEHIFYFSPKNIGDFLEQNGFTVVYNSTIGKRFTFAYIFKTLYKWQKLSIWNTCAEFFSAPSRKKWAIPVNLYDNFFLIARKK